MWLFKEIRIGEDIDNCSSDGAQIMSAPHEMSRSEQVRLPHVEHARKTRILIRLMWTFLWISIVFSNGPMLYWAMRNQQLRRDPMMVYQPFTTDSPEFARTLEAARRQTETFH